MVHHQPTSDGTPSSYLWWYTIILYLWWYTIILPLMVHHHPTSGGTPSSYLWWYTIILPLMVHHHPTSGGTPSSYISDGTPSSYLWWYVDFAWFLYSLLNLTSSSKWMHNFYFHFQFASGFQVIGRGQRFLLWTTWKMGKINNSFTSTIIWKSNHYK